MLTQFNGGPVTGGTFPAEIWRTYMELALQINAEEHPAKQHASATGTATSGNTTTYNYSPSTATTPATATAPSQTRRRFKRRRQRPRRRRQQRRRRQRRRRPRRSRRRRRPRPRRRRRPGRHRNDWRYHDRRIKCRRCASKTRSGPGCCRPTRIGLRTCAIGCVSPAVPSNPFGTAAAGMNAPVAGERLLGSRTFITPARRTGIALPHCGSLQRQRVLWLFIQRETDMLSRPIRVLQIAPDFAFFRRLGQLPLVDYVTGELQRSPIISDQIDITAIPFGDASFDLILCSHVLEHVPDDRTAARELRRVLRPDGIALLQHPLVDRRDRRGSFGGRPRRTSQTLGTGRPCARLRSRLRRPPGSGGGSRVTLRHIRTSFPNRSSRYPAAASKRRTRCAPESGHRRVPGRAGGRRGCVDV